MQLGAQASDQPLEHDAEALKVALKTKQQGRNSGGLR